MALSRQYVVVPGSLPELFRKIQEGQAPEKFTSQHLKDLGFASSNHRTFIPLLKSLGFLSDSGVPTKRYHNYRDGGNSKKILAEALREAYSDLFVIKARPTDADKVSLIGKFKSSHNVTDELAKLMYTTFMALLKLADLDAIGASAPVSVTAQPLTASASEGETLEDDVKHPSTASEPRTGKHRPGLFYNIQIHLPATKDTEVYNAIFKSLKEHLLD